MKESGVPWLGEVPEHWEVLPARAAYRPRQVRNACMEETTVLSLSYGRIVVKPTEKLRGLVPESFETYQIVDPGNIIIRTTDLQNDHASLRVGLAKHRGIITSAYMCLETTPRVSRAFGYQCLNAYDLLKIIYGFGSGLRQKLDYSDIKLMPVVVPSLAEQAAIVRFLDYADRRIRRYIRAKQKLIALLEEQRQAIIQSAMTRGIDPDVRLKPSGVEWLGDVPEHWDVRRAKALCSAIVDCRNRTPNAVEGGPFTVVRTTCVRHGRFDPAGGYRTDEESYRAWTARGAPHQGDVFFTREAPAGEACLVPDRADLCMGQRMMYFRPDPALLDARFLLLSIYGPLSKTYVELATNGSTVGHLRLGQVYALPILWCPIAEQRAIAVRVDRATAEIQAARAKAEAEIHLLREYRTRLIADVVTGKLDVRQAAAQLPSDPVETDAVEEGLLDAETEAKDMDDVADEALA